MKRHLHKIHHLAAFRVRVIALNLLKIFDQPWLCANKKIAAALIRSERTDLMI